MDLSLIPGLLLLYAIGYVIVMIVVFGLATSRESSSRRLYGGSIFNMFVAGITYSVIDSQTAALNNAFHSQYAARNLTWSVVVIALIVIAANLWVTFSEVWRDHKEALRRHG